MGKISQQFDDAIKERHGFWFVEVVFAQHGDIVYNVVLNHVESVMLQSQYIAVLDKADGPSRTNLQLFALPGE